MNEPVRLSDIARCFHGVIPGAIATADSSGIPNITPVSQVYYLDDHHVAVPRLHSDKTSRNLDQTGAASIELYDPLSFQAYRLQVKLVTTETEGELFERMSTRIDAIASHAGMKGVLHLIGCDIFEVEAAVRVNGFLQEPAEPPGAQRDLSMVRRELEGLQALSDRIAGARELGSLFEAALDSLEEVFGFTHMMLLLREGEELVTVASRGYDSLRTVRLGEGLIGTAAERRYALRVTGLGEALRYSRAVRSALETAGMSAEFETPVPGLADVQAALIIPLCDRDQLFGALAVESRDPMAFDDWHEAYLALIGNQLALTMARMIADPARETPKSSDGVPIPAGARVGHRFSYFNKDESLFIDDDYLIRNIPAKIMWKLLREWKGSGRVDFTNRELRLDESLGLPELRDNLESRLILLRKRLDQKCTDVRIVPTGRGRFSLVIQSNVELQEH